jgi:hypothetical protein
MTKSAYDRWLNFISRGSSEGLTFPKDEAIAIMAVLLPTDRNWRRDKREINKAAALARLQRHTPASETASRDA